ncbi:TPA: CcdB family protein [Enterobacter roggenkampii]|jgi:toxin CcdB|uniref:Toxin CcdB n=1 Tax=Citrobacter freundii TaxID=546 RepID=A0AAE7GZT5_CITFR|nr:MULTISPECIES: CcdB family protein [Enterobacterales]EIT7546535.1 CcdB family protein [Escherichia coli]EKN4076000.1 CcdB family protein [Yersinia enterocolitica]HBX5305157.1 cytotoxin [Klebsiella pneumoniae]EKN4146108.1 CcdB family protein [Yersinia enterocolitica]EKN4832584.1 CcdB family protein [Yersinia enterocolitica]
MQFMVYRNNGNSRAYPYLLDVQSDIIGELNTRLVIPLFLLDEVSGRPARRLNPVLNVDGEDFLVMTHEMASVRQSQLGEEVVSVREQRQAIKNALDFLLDGF